MFSLRTKNLSKNLSSKPTISKTLCGDPELQIRKSNRDSYKALSRSFGKRPFLQKLGKKQDIWE